MVWKQDLAKLKAAIRETGAPPPPLPKPKPKLGEEKELHEEDAFFLAAMGAPAPRATVLSAPKATPQAPVIHTTEASFEAEIGALKGLKPLGSHPVLLPHSVPSAAQESAPLAVPAPVAVAPEVVERPSTASEISEAPSQGDAIYRPQRIQLAAGMAVEVDAALDLRHHSAPDALGRLRDRVEDGALLGWRTLQVTLGEDEALHAALLALLEEGGVPKVSRFAQAPIPMGGSQAWILYY